MSGSSFFLLHVQNIFRYESFLLYWWIFSAFWTSASLSVFVWLTLVILSIFIFPLLLTFLPTACAVWVTGSDCIHLPHSLSHPMADHNSGSGRFLFVPWGHSNTSLWLKGWTGPNGCLQAQWKCPCVCVSVCGWTGWGLPLAMLGCNSRGNCWGRIIHHVGTKIRTDQSRFTNYFHKEYDTTHEISAHV